MRFVKSIKKQIELKPNPKTLVIAVLAVLLASIASVMVASTIAVVQVEAKDRNPVKDSKMQRDTQTKLDGGSAFKQQKKGNDIDPEAGDPYIPLELPPPTPLPPPPSQGCFNDPKNC